MSRNGLRRMFLVGAAVLLTLAITSQADALYLFYMRKDLAHVMAKSPKDIVGKQITVTDEMLIMWPQVQQRPDQLEGQKFVLFDTTYFHCAVPADSMGSHLESIWEDAQKGYGEVTTQIEETNVEQAKGRMTPSQGADKRRELYWELYRLWSNKPIVTLYGTVARADFWGEVKGKDQGVATETITIVVDRVEKPRKRWYRALDN